MKTRSYLGNVLLLTALVFSHQGWAEAAGTVGTNLQQFVQQSLPGGRLLPEGSPKPRTLVSPSNEPLDLMTALRENSQPRKGAGYWATPTMRYLNRQHISITNANDAVAVVQLFHALTRGAKSVNQNIYNATAVEGGWVVQVESKSPATEGRSAVIPPYELLVGAGRTLVELRERCYLYLGSPVVYDRTVRAVYEREVKRDGALNFQSAIEKELATEWEKEKAQRIDKK
jgi:hypothetical protein